MAHNYLTDQRIEYDNYQRSYDIKINGSNISFPGVDVGGRITAKTSIEDGKAAIIHVAGHNGWSGRGDTTYYPPNLRVGLITVEEIDSHGFKYGHLQIVQIIHYTRKFRQEAYQAAENLYSSLNHPASN